jgi:hypothetical protein
MLDSGASMKVDEFKEGSLEKGITWSSSPGEFHPQALTETDVTVSRHPALIIQSLFLATLPYLLAPPISG